MPSTMVPTAPVSMMFTRLRGNAAKLTKVRVRVTPTDCNNPLPGVSALNRVLRTGYAAKRPDPSSSIYVEDTRFGRRVSCDGIAPVAVPISAYLSEGRHTVELPAGILRRTIKRPTATANLSKPAAKKRAKLEREMQCIHKTKTEPAKAVLKNHFILVADASGSMAAHADGAAKLFNEQLAQLEKSNADGAQLNTVTLFRFHNPDTIVERYYNVPPATIPRLDARSWEATGASTPLYDAVVFASQRAMADTDPERSFVVFVLTDGQENASRRYNAEALRQFIATQQATDRWTFVFMVPRGYAEPFCKLSGVPAGNVKEWDRIDDAEIKTSGIATQSYLSQRAAGHRSSKTWFTTNLAAIGTRQLVELREVTGQVAVWTTEDQEDVRTFIDRKSKGRFGYGMRFFEFMKKEDDFADYKKLLLMDKTTKRIYADGAATIRALIGLPLTGSCAIDPTASNLGNYVLFGQSTSTNRILPRGTRVAFWS